MKITTKSGMTVEKKRKNRILVVDDHPLYRDGLKQFIGSAVDLEVCGEAGDSGTALRMIEELKPDLVTLDISLQGPNGIESLKSINARFRALPVLVISMHDESLYAERALRAGAKGYVMKSEAADNVTNAVRKILKGQIYLSEAMTARMLEKQIRGIPQEVSSVESLSDRELEVFQLIGEGESTNHIAERLHLSVKTIETYRANIKNKLNLRDNTDLIKHAVQWVETEQHK